MLTLAERMDRLTSPEPTSKKGYGRVWVGPGRSDSDLAHAVNYRRFKGMVPKGLVLRHKCDMPSCVNPDHLVVGTNKDNYQDMVDRHPERVFGGEPIIGESVGTSVLMAVDVATIRSVYASGKYTMTEIAHEFGVSKATIRSAIRRITWRHV